MRKEIKFRGQESENKKWVYGFYQEYPKGYVHIQNEYNDWFPVLPDTVGQYIGIKDKNGREIYEGDIIEVCTFGFNPERFITEVIYEKCAFRLKNGRNMFYCGQSDFTKMDDAKVIGNIFDNPEFLKGDGEK